MHNCKATRGRLIELALDKMVPDQSGPLLDELEHCHACREEFASLRGVLRIADQAMEATTPSDNFWAGYHARLGESLKHDSPSRDSSPAVRPRTETGAPVTLRGLLQKLATASVAVPVPVAAVAIVFFGLSIVYAMHSRPQATAAPLTVTPLVVTKTVEVPVIHDRVITRVVYRDRNQRPLSEILRPEKIARTQSKVMDRRNEPVANLPISLVGFKPTSDPKLTIIKGSYRDDK